MTIPRPFQLTARANSVRRTALELLVAHWGKARLPCQAGQSPDARPKFDLVLLSFPILDRPERRDPEIAGIAWEACPS